MLKRSWNSSLSSSPLIFFPVKRIPHLTLASDLVLLQAFIHITGCHSLFTCLVSSATVLHPHPVVYLYQTTSFWWTIASLKFPLLSSLAPISPSGTLLAPTFLAGAGVVFVFSLRTRHASARECISLLFMQLSAFCKPGRAGTSAFVSVLSTTNRDVCLCRKLLQCLFVKDKETLISCEWLSDAR